MFNNLNITDASVLYRSKERISVFLLFFLLFSFVGQLFQGTAIAKIAFLFSVIVVVIVALKASRHDLFLFMFIVISMRVIIPITADREFQLVLPLFFLAVSIIRFFPRFQRIKKKYAHHLFFIFCLFMLCCVIGVLNGIKIPGMNSPTGVNSGLLNRFNLFNCVVTFFASIILFDCKQLDRWLNYFFKFYLIVLFVSLIVILFDLKVFPLFNTFTWSIIIEGDSSKKLVIAGLASLMIFIYTLVFVRRKLKFYLLIVLSITGLLLSGGRSPFIFAIFISFIFFVVKHQILGKSLVFLIIGVILSTYILLSPIILLVPERYQRLVIIFPPEYYTGKLSELANSPAASSTAFRLELWEMSLEKIKKKPLVGNSFGIPEADYSFEGNSLKSFQKIPKEILYNDFLMTGSLHNTLFSIAYLLGIPALFAFAYVLARLIWAHYKKSIVFDARKKQIAIFITLCLINQAITALVTDLLFDLTFFVLIAIALKVFLFYYNSETHVIQPNVE